MALTPGENDSFVPGYALRICMFGNLSRWFWYALRFGSPWILWPLRFSQLIKLRFLWKIKRCVKKERTGIYWISIMCQTFLHILPPLFLNTVLKFQFQPETQQGLQNFKGHTAAERQNLYLHLSIWFPLVEPWHGLEQCSPVEFWSHYPLSGVVLPSLL